MNQRLQELVNVIPILKNITGNDAAFTVFDKEAVIQAYFPSKAIPLHFEVGSKVDEASGPVMEAYQKKSQIYIKIPKEAFGVAFEGTVTPIKDGTEIVGAVTYLYSTEQREEIVNNTNKLTEALSNTDESINGIKGGTKELASNMSKVQQITELVKTQVEEATSVVDEIQKNAKYSNILALNASIESARAGQAGKGFAVVSDEMRKFSELSSRSAQKIGGNLSEIVRSLNEVRDAIVSSASIADEQANAANHLNEMFDSVVESANKVNDICKTKVNF